MKRKIIWLSSISIVFVLTIIFFTRYFFVFGEGVKAGELNYMVYKGYVFKTYEGKLIQSGFRGQVKDANTSRSTMLQSYEFEFSVTDEHLADSLMRCSGRTVELHYKEYLAPIFWRGVSKYVVDDIVAVH